MPAVGLLHAVERRDAGVIERSEDLGFAIDLAT